MHNVSVGTYMASGGTNFGFTAGGSLHGVAGQAVQASVTTSYDFNAPVTEAGDVNASKWLALQALFSQFNHQPMEKAKQNKENAERKQKKVK